MVFSRADRLTFAVLSAAMRWGVLAIAGIAAGCCLLGSPLVSAAGAATVDPVAAGVPGNGRAWELVTPEEPTSDRLDLGWFAAYINRSLVRAISTDGDRLVYRTGGSPEDASAGASITESIAERGSDGWSSRPLAYPRPETLGAAPLIDGEEGSVALNPELTKALWVNALALSGDSLGVGSTVGMFAGSPGPPYAMLTEIGTELGKESRFVTATPNLDRAFFMSQSHLLPADAGRTAAMSLYEYSAGGTQLVEVQNNGSLIGPCGSSFNTISGDGSEVFFTAHPFNEFVQSQQEIEEGTPYPTCGAKNEVYLRSGGHTTEISKSQCTLADCGEAQDASFLGLSPDGSTAFIASAQRLTDADNEGERMLYRYDLASGALTQLYPQPLGSSANNFSDLQTSTDGSRVYFALVGQLLPGQGSETGTNLYLDDGSGLHLVAPATGNTLFASLLLSSDGRYAVFESPAKLAPGDTDERIDIYRYDADTNTIKLVSGGAGGAGNGSFDATLSKTLGTLDGDRTVVFETAEQLLPQDHNDKTDVYEWTEAGGLDLISAGTPGYGADVTGATADGRTVVFRTNATLLARDHDLGEMDLYAARIGGGFPEPPEPSEPSQCAGAGCDSGTAGGSATRRISQAPLERRLEVGSLDRDALRQLSHKGSTTVLVEVPKAGRLTIAGKARGGGSVASGSAIAKAPGPLPVALKLEPAARRALARGGSIRIRLFLTLAGDGTVRGPAFILTPPGASAGHRGRTTARHQR